jgi:type IV pilus assembly protein PilY1
MDDIRIYNRALSEEEISALYNQRSRRTITSSPRVSYYNTQSHYDSNSHPSNSSELDEFYDTSNSGVSSITNRVHDRNSIYHGDGGQSSTFGSVNGAPDYFTRFDGYSWKITGTFTTPETGTYTFGVDGDDAVDVQLDGTVVASWYGGHGFDGDVANHSGTIDLKSGNSYEFVARYEEGGGGSGIAIGWQKPSDSSWNIFPAQLLV